jgi:hypothetical protein
MNVNYGRIARVLVLAGAVSSLVVATGLARATPPATATIELMRNQDLEEIGWNGSFPGFSDAGSWTSNFRAFGGGNSPVFAGLIKTTETGAHGTFQTSFQVLDSKGTFSGTCQISGGTGDYAHLQGTGPWSFREQGDTRVYTCVVQAHWD